MTIRVTPVSVIEDTACYAIFIICVVALNWPATSATLTCFHLCMVLLRYTFFHCLLPFVCKQLNSIWFSNRDNTILKELFLECFANIHHNLASTRYCSIQAGFVNLAWSSFYINIYGRWGCAMLASLLQYKMSWNMPSDLLYHYSASNKTLCRTHVVR